METKELIERYLEETKVLEDDNNCVVIAYGSRITGSSSVSSDLDVFVVTLSRGYYRKAQVIDGINTETNFISIDLLMEYIYFAHINNNAYYESVFSSGLVMKNESETLESIKKTIEEIKEFGPKKKRNIPVRIGIQIHEYLDSFRSSNDNLKDYYYYNLLELIRNTYHFINNFSSINLAKAYDIYINSTYGEEVYKMVLPSVEFRSSFLSAVNKDGDISKNIERLLGLLNYSEINYVDSLFSNNVYTFTDNLQIKKILISLNKRVCKVEEMLIYNHPCASYVYYVLLDGFKKFYKEIYNEVSDEFDELFDDAIKSNDVDERIRFIEKMFWLIEKTYRFDYDDYVLRYE